jgi:hypothetical protein
VYVAGDVESVLVDLGSLDEPFVDWRRSGPPHATILALARFWSIPELAPLRAAIDAPHFGWNNLATALLDLAHAEIDTEVTADIDWTGVLGRAVALGREDRLAAAGASLYALAGWEGTYADRKPLDPGWYTIPPRVSELLLDAGGFRSAGDLNLYARRRIERSVREVYRPEFIAAMAPYRRVVSRLAARWQDDIAGLAWDLRAVCVPAEPHLRGAIAALLWVTGDATRAELIADDPGYTPSLGALRQMIARSVPSIAGDLFAQHVWLALKDRPPLDLRRHRQLFASINARPTDVPLYELDDLMGPFAPTQTFAAGLIAYLSRTVSAEIRADIAGAWSAFRNEIIDADPIAGLRFRALHHLVIGNDSWHDIARDATELLDHAVRRSDRGSLQLWLDLPLSYLDDDAALPALERHRVAGLAYQLTTAAPPAAPADGMDALLRREAELLDELRATRFILMLAYLPAHYRQFTVDIRTLPGFEELPEGIGTFADYDALYDPGEGPHALDHEVTHQRIAQAWDDLRTLWHRMAEISPAYAGRRLDPSVDLDGFTAALTVAGADARPVGATPIRRTDFLTPITDLPAGLPRLEPDYLASLAASLLDQYQRTNNVNFLGGAIQADVDALALVPQRTPAALSILDHLSMLRAVLYLHTGDEQHLNTAIIGHETAVMQSKAPGVPNELRATVRFNTGMDLMYRYQAHRDPDDLERALASWRAAALVPGLDPQQRSTIYHTYLRGLADRYEHTGDREALERAVASINEAMARF